MPGEGCVARCIKDRRPPGFVGVSAEAYLRFPIRFDVGQGPVPDAWKECVGLEATIRFLAFGCEQEFRSEIIISFEENRQGGGSLSQNPAHMRCACF